MTNEGPTPEQVRAEVERLEAKDREKAARAEARMAELREDARKRRKAEAEQDRRDKARREKQREDLRQAAEDREKRAAFNTWVAQGGSPSEFEGAWPNLRREMLTKRTLERDSQARQLQRTSGVSRI